MIVLTKESCSQALYGGLLLGGGGGGSLALGLEALEEAFRHTKTLKLMDIAELPDDGILVNVSLVGAPSAKEICVTAEHWKTVLKNFELNSNTRIAGFTTCENGGVSTSNGWIISALTGIPLVDAPSDGRAHPTGMMGSIGLNLCTDYVTIQSACGGNPDHYVETVVRGGLQTASQMVRQTAVAAGGMCCVLRNPVTVTYAQTHAAVGAFAQALEIGKGYLEHENDIDRFLSFLNGGYGAEVICEGTVCDYSLQMDGGYDVGVLHVQSGTDDYELTYWNEYMTLEKNGRRIGTFPDLLCTLDASTGLPVSSAEVQENMRVLLLKIPQNRLILGAGLRQKQLMRDVEAVLRKELVLYHEELFDKQTS